MNNTIHPMNSRGNMGHVPAPIPILSDDIERSEILSQLTALDFMAVDLHLYLDTHPNDKAALARYNCVIMQADTLRIIYQSNYGPLYSYRSPSSYPWQWVDGPWPWNKQFNFELAGEEK